jgi:hypothetical protein
LSFQTPSMPWSSTVRVRASFHQRAVAGLVKSR